MHQIGSANALPAYFVEHHESVTAARKNIIARMTRFEIKVWQGKPKVMLAATAGPGAGASVLENQAILSPHFGADVIGQLGIGDWNSSQDSNKNYLTRISDVKALDKMLSELI